MPVYKLDIASHSPYFNTLTIYTSRYSTEDNYLHLCLKPADIKISRIVVDTLVNNLKPQTRNSIHIHLKEIPCLHSIAIDGCKAREIAADLFLKNYIAPEKRSMIEGPLYELEECMGYHLKLIPNISNNQLSILRDKVNPYLPLLKKYMEPWHLEQALCFAADVYSSLENPEKDFEELVRETAVKKHGEKLVSISNPNIPMIPDRLNPDIQSRIIDALYNLGEILSGAADLEDTLTESDSSLPKLEIQREFILNLFGIYTTPPRR